MADWSRLTQHLEEQGAGRVVLSFPKIETIIGSALPASSKYPAFWSNGSSYARAWKRAGYESTRRDVPSGHMGFVRTRTSTAQTPVSSAATATNADVAAVAEPEVLLVGW